MKMNYHLKINNNKKEIDEKAIINFRNDIDIDGCWMWNKYNRMLWTLG